MQTIAAPTAIRRMVVAASPRPGCTTVAATPQAAATQQMQRGTVTRSPSLTSTTPIRRVSWNTAIAPTPATMATANQRSSRRASCDAPARVQASRPTATNGPSARASSTGSPVRA